MAADLTTAHDPVETMSTAGAENRPSAGADNHAAAVRAGSVAELRAQGRLLTKVGALPVVVFWDDGHRVRHRRPVPAPRLPAASGHGRGRSRHVSLAPRPLRSRVGCTLDLWADDARGFTSTSATTTCSCSPPCTPIRSDTSRRRLRNGLEDDISLVVAKSVLGLLDAGVPASEIVRTGVEFGARYRSAGWGVGLTVLVAMANLLPQLDA